jgi:Phycobilisome protein
VPTEGVVITTFEQMVLESDGSYLSQSQHDKIDQYVSSVPERISTYRALQEYEKEIIDEVYSRLVAQDASLLKYPDNSKDLRAKWQRDTKRVYCYTCNAMLINDPEWLKDTILYWFSTVMKSYKALPACEATYAIMKDVTQEKLGRTAADLINPYWELNRQILSPSQ